MGENEAEVRDHSHDTEMEQEKAWGTHDRVLRMGSGEPTTVILVIQTYAMPYRLVVTDHQWVWRQYQGRVEVQSARWSMQKGRLSLERGSGHGGYCSGRAIGRWGIGGGGCHRTS
jgi:hypothetical protein